MTREYSVVVTKELHLTVTVDAISIDDAREMALFRAGEEPADSWYEDQDALRTEQPEILHG